MTAAGDVVTTAVLVGQDQGMENARRLVRRTGRRLALLLDHAYQANMTDSELRPMLSSEMIRGGKLS
jgi:hypothetical protein